MEKKNIVRVILRSDGSVHIAFEDIRTIYATPANLLELFSDPNGFIENGSKGQPDSTFLANRKRVSLDEVLGLTLATVNSDKQIVCDFPELFQYLSQNNDTKEMRNKPLRMEDFENRMVLSDEKAYLLRFFLEFTHNLKSRVAIQKNIHLRHQVQSAIMKEILNSYFEEELPEPEKSEPLSGFIEKSENMYQPEKVDPTTNMVTVKEYARIHGFSENTVRKYINDNKLVKTRKVGRLLYVDKDELPPSYDKRKGRKRKKTGEEKFFKRAVEGSPEEVRAYIRDNDLWDDEIGRFIRSYQECDYYVNNSYHHLCLNGQNVLAVDVNPDYLVPDNMVPDKVRKKYKDEPSKQYRNRDLMAAGCAPVVPNKHKDQFIYHVHHIGQRPESPFCLLPEFQHNSKEYSSIFHQGSIGVELHTPEFEARKAACWKELLHCYDAANGDFNKIPYNSPRKTRYKKSKK